jgi:tRNA pseudouridine55 synthase
MHSINGIVPVHKPIRWTSFDVVAHIRTLMGKPERIPNHPKRHRVGHAGTLDPLATGVLVICFGQATKTIDQIQALDKEYTGTIHLGATTPSADLETNVDQRFTIDHINEQMILETARLFVGSINQVPPAHSAVKVAGRRAYQWAREGSDKQPTSRTVCVHSFEITEMKLPEISFRIVCSKGTYIRSIARDFGTALKSGAHLQALCRTRIGQYQLSQCIAVDELPDRIGLLRQAPPSPTPLP